MAEILKPKRQVLNAVKASILRRESRQAERSNYYLNEEVLLKGRVVPIPRQTVKTDRPTLMAFADDAPLLNWAHPCRYLLHDAETGELVREVEAQFPPFANERSTPKTFYAFHKSVDHLVQVKYPIRPDIVVRPSLFGSRYAILFSGMSNNRHTNDLEFLYRTLRTVYGVPAGNIVVLNYDGTLDYSGAPHPVTAWPGDNSAYQMPVHGQGSKADLLGALDDMKSRLKANDSLLIHTNNHGGHNGTESDLCCYPNWDSLGVEEFTDKLAELPAFRCLMVMMEQCHSGGFNSKVIAKSTAGATSIASACEEDRNSIGGAHFDPFARDWIAAMNGATPYGGALAHDPDTNGNGRISAREAFDYADAIHDPYDTPVFNQKNGGSGCWLGSDWYIFKLPPLELAEIYIKHWPEPDPIILQRRVEAVMPQIEALNKDFEPQLDKLHANYRKRFEAILKAARRAEK